MPLMNKNYVTPAWIDNAAPPINDDELNAMSQTLEGSQILVGNGAPTSSTPGKVGQRYADISTTPPTMYRLNGQGFPGQPMPQAQTAAQLKTTGYRVGKLLQHDAELCVGASNNRAVTVLVYGKSAPGEDNRIDVLATCTESFTVYHTFVYGSGATGGVTGTGSGTPDPTTGLYTARFGAGVGYHETDDIEIYAPEYQGIDAAMQAAANPPFMWEQEKDPNRNIAREYSTGSSYAAGDYCIHDGWLYKALEATGGAWDGSKWEQAKYADDLSGHETDQNNPHNVTAAQTGAVSPPVLATVQATTAAVRDYFAGEYFFYEGQLYEVKEAVAQGGDLFASGTSEPAALGDGVTALRPKTGTVTIGTFWSGSGPYSQTVTVTGAAVTTKSKVDLTPTAAQLETLAADGVLSLTIENNGGTLTAWVVGTQPSAAMTVSCVVRETA